MKTCTKCSQEKSLDAYYWNKQPTGALYRHSVCQDCRREQNRAWSKTTAGKQTKRAGILNRHYKVSPVAYSEMSARQGGLCAICLTPEMKTSSSGALYRLSVDHDHATGKVRALLCQGCNVGLGSFKDESGRLRRAAAYLDGHRERFNLAPTAHQLQAGGAIADVTG